MATATEDMDAEHAASLRRRYLIRFEEDTLRPRPLWIRLIIEFLGKRTSSRSGSPIRSSAAAAS